MFSVNVKKLIGNFAYNMVTYFDKKLFLLQISTNGLYSIFDIIPL
jgi:hypothetical protein